MSQTFIYAISNSTNNTIKIGYSKNPKKRVAELQVATADPLALLFSFVGDFQLEQQIHHQLEDYRVSGDITKRANPQVMDWTTTKSKVLTELNERQAQSGYYCDAIIIGDVIVLRRTKEERERINKVMEERLNQLQSRPVTLNEPTKASRDS
jgi:hypothetical protein